MILVQTLLLHVALTNRPGSHTSTSNSSTHLKPFAASDPSSEHHQPSASRPFKFWQWRQRRQYWLFLLSFTSTLLVLQLLLGGTERYTALLGYVGLMIEATLPIPQILANARRRSCKGFRPSVLVNWLVGDVFKLTFFFLKDSSEVPPAFKLCGVFQACCDAYLGVQYFRYGSGGGGVREGILTPRGEEMRQLG